MKRKGTNFSVIVIALAAAVILGCMEASRVVTVFSAVQLRQAQTRIVIDPGHGGIDGGATSCTGKLESGYNLEIGLRLRDLLHLLGYGTIMTRSTDMSIHTAGDTIAAQKMSDLKQRVRIVNEEENRILVSIHQNQFTDSRYYGAQVFYSHDEISKLLAGQMQNNLVSTLNPGSSRKEKKAEGIYLMEHIRNPGILVECGFLSNPQEEAKLSDPEYQKKLCSVITVTLAQFLDKE